jgi:carboxyl-terminal processing protease
MKAGVIMKKVLKSVGVFLLAFCVLVTGVLGAVTVAYPRQVVDFFEVMVHIKQDFLEPVTLGTLIDGATVGLTEAVKDAHTYYLDPETNRMVALSNMGKTGGVGVTVEGVKSNEDRLVILEITPDSGAQAAGLLPKDAILKVDDEWVKDMSVEKAISMVRGEPGTSVRLLIQREGEADKEYAVERTTMLAIETVAGGVLKNEYLPDHKIGYIAIGSFAQNSHELFNDLLDQLLSENIEGLILDLRNNGGGDVAATTKIASRLMNDGELIRLVLRGGANQSFQITNADPIKIPLVVLVNGGSASASEILSGAIQDNKVGVLVGTQTYGKGSVQNVYNMLTGAGLRVTEGKYLLPSGRSIDGIGVAPDHLVENDPQSERDAQLDKAVELMKTMGNDTVGEDTTPELAAS